MADEKKDVKDKEAKEAAKEEAKEARDAAKEDKEAAKDVAREDKRLYQNEGGPGHPRVDNTLPGELSAPQTPGAYPEQPPPEPRKRT